MDTAVRENLKGIPVNELEARMVELGHPAFRGRQLFRWIYSERESDFEKMTDISKSFRSELMEKFCLPTLQFVEERKSVDGTI